MKKELIEVEFNFGGFEYNHDQIIGMFLEDNGFSEDEIFDINLTENFYEGYVKILHDNMENYIFDNFGKYIKTDRFMLFNGFINKPYSGTIKSKINLHTLRRLYSMILTNHHLKAKFEDLLREYRTSGDNIYWNVTNKIHLWEPEQLGLIIETLLSDFNEHEAMFENSDKIIELIYI